MERTEVAGLVAKISATFATSTFFGALLNCFRGDLPRCAARIFWEGMNLRALLHLGLTVGRTGNPGNVNRARPEIDPINGNTECSSSSSP